MHVNQGRPADLSGRQDKELRVYDFLDGLHIAYVQVDHAAAMTMEACAAADETLGTALCKNLLLCNRQCTDFYLLLLPGNKVFKTKDLSKQLGVSRLSFAGGEYMEQFLDITPGSLSVLGLINDKENRVRLVIDKDVLAEEYLSCHPCVNTSSLRLRTADLLNTVLPATGHGYTPVELIVEEA